MDVMRREVFLCASVQSLFGKEGKLKEHASFSHSCSLLGSLSLSPLSITLSLISPSL